MATHQRVVGKTVGRLERELNGLQSEKNPRRCVENTTCRSSKPLCPTKSETYAPFSLAQRPDLPLGIAVREEHTPPLYFASSSRINNDGIHAPCRSRTELVIENLALCSSSPS